MQQLNLSETCINSQKYHRGDWVLVKRKPKNDGAYLKRGDKVQIEFAHPTNGSVRFWNDRCNKWDYLWPEDIKLCLPPADAATEINVESVVREPILESVVGELVAAKPIVESVLGEISPAAQTTVEPVVGEPILESVVGERKNYYNSDKGYSGNGWLESHYKIRRDGKQHSINCPEIGCTGPYNSYRWMEGKRQRAKYCPGSKCTAVRKALRSGEPISKILEIINQ